MSNQNNINWEEAGNNLEDAPDKDNSDSSEDYPLGGMWEEKDIQDEKELVNDNRDVEAIKRLSNVISVVDDYMKRLLTEKEAVRLIRAKVMFWDNEDMGKNYDGFGNFIKKSFKPLSEQVADIKI